MSQIRISKLLSERGICSRREADRYIEQGQVCVNGEVISELGSKCPEDAHIELLSSAKRAQEKKVTILLHKPVGYVSTQPEKGYSEALELITPENQVGAGEFHFSHLKKLAVVGRLDIDSKGLLLLTQDGTLAKKIIGPESNVEKEYLVRVEGRITHERLESLRFGLFLDEKPLKRAKVDEIQPGLLKFILTEGKKRQIRRMCDIVGLDVTSLKRVRVDDIRLGDLPMGKWCYYSHPGDARGRF